MESNCKKILILYAAIGIGHKTIAENIGFYLEAGGYEVVLHDEHKIQTGFLVNWGTKLYLFFLNHFPAVWSWLYNSNWFSDLTMPWRLKVAAANYRDTLEVITRLQPDAIISTHTTASGVMAYLKKNGLYTGAFGIAFSDFHLHRYWLYDQADFYLANIAEQKEQMLELGIPAEKIYVCGMVLKPKAQINIGQVKNKLGIAADKKVLLISSGSQGTGIDQKLIAQFVERPKLKVVVICGKNKNLFEDLSKKFNNSNILVFGFYSPMDELYAVSDIYITKPGGLSVAEALVWRLPILVSHLLPGQEEHNYSYLLEKGLVMPEPINIVESVLEELATGGFKKALAQNSALNLLFKAANGPLEALNQVLKKGV